jgi:hypothetical protein
VKMSGYTAQTQASYIGWWLNVTCVTSHENIHARWTSVFAKWQAKVYVSQGQARQSCQTGPNVFLTIPSQFVGAQFITCSPHGHSTDKYNHARPYQTNWSGTTNRGKDESIGQD